MPETATQQRGTCRGFHTQGRACVFSAVASGLAVTSRWPGAIGEADPRGNTWSILRSRLRDSRTGAQPTTDEGFSRQLRTPDAARSSRNQRTRPMAIRPTAHPRQRVHRPSSDSPRWSCATTDAHSPVFVRVGGADSRPSGCGEQDRNHGRAGGDRCGRRLFALPNDDTGQAPQQGGGVHLADRRRPVERVAAAPAAPRPSSNPTAAPVRRLPAGISPLLASMEARLTPVAVTPHAANIPAVSVLVAMTARSGSGGWARATRRRAVSANAAIAARAAWADQYFPVLTSGTHTGAGKCAGQWPPNCAHQFAVSSGTPRLKSRISQ
jgi:hypothetical protein